MPRKYKCGYGDSGIFHGIPQESDITTLYHVIENTVVNTISATYAQSMMGRLDVILLNIEWLSCILIGCIFCGMVKKYFI